jgi:hypothetical protein
MQRIPPPPYCRTSQGTDGKNAKNMPFLANRCPNSERLYGGCRRFPPKLPESIECQSDVSHRVFEATLGSENRRARQCARLRTATHARAQAASRKVSNEMKLTLKWRRCRPRVKVQHVAPTLGCRSDPLPVGGIHGPLGPRFSEAVDRCRRYRNTTDRLASFPRSSV